MHSIVQSGLIPGGKSNRRDRQSVFFTAVNPMDDNQDLDEEVQYNLDKPRIAPYKHIWRTHHITGVLVQFKACSEKGIAILSDSVDCNYSFKHTASDLCRKKWYA